MRTRASTGLVAVSLALAGCGDKPAKRENQPAEAARKAKPVVTGRVGDTLVVKDEYEQDGRPVDDELAITVRDVDTHAKRQGFVLPEEKGARWARARVRIRQEGSTPTSPLVETFAFVDREDQDYPAEHTAPFKPSLTPHSNPISLAPGRARQGFIGAKIPKRARIVLVRFSDDGFGPLPDAAEWRVSG